MKKTLLISSIIIIIALLAEAYRENLGMSWQRYQAGYKEELLKLATTPKEKELAQHYKIKMRHVVLPELDRVDRCVICHVAMEDSRMKDMPNPIRTHPGDILAVHEVDKVGCTICHDGQGRAITFEQALAHGHGKYWEKPILSSPYFEANCYRCHHNKLAATPHYNAGKDLFETRGCLGCHQINGKGGVKGPDLSDIANASFHVKMPTSENREQLLKKFSGNINLAYLYESVKQPHAQPTESGMFDYHFTEEEALNMTVYLKSLSTDSVPLNLVSKKALKVSTTSLGRGARLYGMYCAACHGIDGSGTHFAELSKVGPAIGNQEFLAIADEKLLEHAVNFSRGGEMPAFKTTGGLSTEEIRDIVAYLQSFKKTPPTIEEVRSVEGNAKYGRIFFQGNCSNCHGIEGKFETDLIGPTINNPTLLGLATEKFWYQTIVGGRSGTAMPAWHFLKKEQLADLIAYLESLKPEPLDKEKVLALAKDSSSLRIGRIMYGGQCSICHGMEGEGGIGPNLRNEEFQRVADAGFILNVMTKGRPGTAMASMNHLKEEDAADIIAYIKSWQKATTPSISLLPKKIIGSEREGQRIFEEACIQCHGGRQGTMTGPAILSRGFLEQVPDQYIKEMVTYGRSHTAMRPAAREQGGIVELEEEEINSVVAYIRSFEEAPVTLEGRSTISGEPVLGKHLFSKNCAQCHGNFAEGGTGPALGKKELLDTVSDGFLFAVMRMGRPGSEMKAFTPHGDGFSNLTEKEVADIINFLRSDYNKADRYRKKVRGLPEHGGELFARNCAQCHGKGGSGGFAPDLSKKLFLEAASDSYLQATMAIGRHDTQMRSMMKGRHGVSELSSRDVNDIIVYLRSLVQK